MLTIGSLFSGIGGLELGLERATGGRTIWQCESDPFCRDVLAKHWPGVPCFRDVRAMFGGVAPVDLICGGFPCQDVSQAGKREGLDGKQSGLWREFARIIRELDPGIVFVENVPGLLVRGFGTVLGDLADLGFDAEWCCVRAADCGAPHLRRRVFLLATRRNLSNTERDPLRLIRQWNREQRGEQGQAIVRSNGTHGAVANTNGTGSQRAESKQTAGWSRSALSDRGWEIEPGMGRVADGVPRRVDRLRSLGNAVVYRQVELAWEILSARAAALSS